MGGPINLILYQMPPASTTTATGAATGATTGRMALLVVWLLYCVKAVVMFSAAVIDCRLINVCLYMT